jgi:hypothetical protein
VIPIFEPYANATDLSFNQQADYKAKAAISEWRLYRRHFGTAIGAFWLAAAEPNSIADIGPVASIPNRNYRCRSGSAFLHLMSRTSPPNRCVSAIAA